MKQKEWEDFGAKMAKEINKMRKQFEKITEPLRYMSEGARKEFDKAMKKAGGDVDKMPEEKV